MRKRCSSRVGRPDILDVLHTISSWALVNVWKTFVGLAIYSSIYRDVRSPRFRWQTVRVEVRTGYREKYRFSVGGARSKTTLFALLGYPSSGAQPIQEIVLPQINGTDGKLRLWRCAFCYSLERLWPGIWERYRPLKGTERWSRDHHENLHMDTQKKIHWFQKCYSFRYTTKKLSDRGKPFPNSGVTTLCPKKTVVPNFGDNFVKS